MEKMTQMMTFDEEKNGGGSGSSGPACGSTKFQCDPGRNEVDKQCTPSKGQELSIIRYDIKLAQCISVIGDGDAGVMDETKETEVGKRV